MLAAVIVMITNRKGASDMCNTCAAHAKKASKPTKKSTKK